MFHWKTICIFVTLLEKREIMMAQFIRKNLLYLIGGAMGAIGGYLYYIYIGCNSGSCPITSSPIMSVIWGAVLGGLIVSMFKKEKKSDD